MDRLKQTITQIAQEVEKAVGGGSRPAATASEAFVKPRVGTEDIIIDRRMCERDGQCMRDRMLREQ